jgi:hypothetical protein
MATDDNGASKTNGPAAAALAAGGLGCATLGALTTWAEVSPEAAKSLNWWPPVGPLSGKAGAATGVFLASWLGLHLTWRRRDIEFERVAVVSTLLLALGAIGTFPPFFRGIAERFRA